MALSYNFSDLKGASVWSVTLGGDSKNITGGSTYTAHWF